MTHIDIAPDILMWGKKYIMILIIQVLKYIE